MIIFMDFLKKIVKSIRSSIFASSLIIFAILCITATYADTGQSNSKQDKKRKKSISITFDELPTAQTFIDSDRGDITKGILTALKQYDIKSTGFVVGERIDGGFDLLGQWLNEGHFLGNLTNSHLDLNEVGIESFIQDIKAGQEAIEPMLTGFGQKKRYFRFPFLHYGNTIDKKREILLYLDATEQTIASATVVVEDYLYNMSLEKLGDNVDSTALASIGNDYISHVLLELENSEKLASEVLKRPCRQILLLRANRLNSMFLDQLLTTIEKDGYRFISLDEALKDELYSAPEAYFGARGVGYIQMLKESEADLLPAQ